MTTACYSATFVAGLERRLADVTKLAAANEADRAAVVAKLTEVLTDNGRLMQNGYARGKHVEGLEQEVRNLKREVDHLQRESADWKARATAASAVRDASWSGELGTARSDLKATRLIVTRQDELIDDRNEQVKKLTCSLSDAASARDRFAVTAAKTQALLDASMRDIAEWRQRAEVLHRQRDVMQERAEMFERMVDGSAINGIRYEMNVEVGQPAAVKIWWHSTLVFDGVARSAGLTR